MKVALVHDWLTNFAGAEKVLLELHRLFPDAPIYTSVYRPEKVPHFIDADIRVSFLQKWPMSHRHQLYPLLRRRAFQKFDLSEYDLVISSSTAESKAVRVRPNAVHVHYCNTPTRYYWSHYDEYLADPGFGGLNPFIRLVMPGLVKRLRRLDYRDAQNVDFFIANSTTVKQRIKTYYHKDATVIFPPVDVERFGATKKRERKGFLIVGRQVPYKRIDLAIAACNELGEQLTVIGTGSEHDKLEAMAGPTIEFLTNVTDLELPNYYQGAEGFIFPAEEDFGIVPVEAMAAGCPVIAYGKGGATDTVVDGETGIFFDKQTVASLKKAIIAFRKSTFKEAVLKRQAAKFSTEYFHKKVKKFVTKVSPR